MLETEEEKKEWKKKKIYTHDNFNGRDTMPIDAPEEDRKEKLKTNRTMVWNELKIYIFSCIRYFIILL